MDGWGSEGRKQSAGSVDVQRPATITVAWRHDKFACQEGWEQIQKICSHLCFYTSPLYNANHEQEKCNILDIWLPIIFLNYFIHSL